MRLGDGGASFVDYRQVQVQLNISPGQGWQPGQPPRASKRLHTVWGSTLHKRSEAVTAVNIQVPAR